MRSWIVVFVLLARAGSDALAGPAGFTQSRADVEAITRGISDAFECATKYVTARDMSNCEIAGLRAATRQTTDRPAYEVGFCFEAWRDLDVEWVSDQQLVKSHQAPAASVADDESETAAMFLLYRNARDKLGVSDSQLLALTRMIPEGKTKTWERLQYWAKRVH